jgi:hypothetical protein
MERKKDNLSGLTAIVYESTSSEMGYREIQKSMAKPGSPKNDGHFGGSKLAGVLILNKLGCMSTATANWRFSESRHHNSSRSDLSDTKVSRLGSIGRLEVRKSLNGETAATP